MAFADRSQIAATDGRESSRAGRLMAVILLAALMATFAIRQLVRAEALAPAIVTFLFAGSAVTAGLALLCRRDRSRIMWLDLAGSLTFVGIVISVFIEPDELTRLVSVSDQPE